MSESNDTTDVKKENTAIEAEKANAASAPATKRNKADNEAPAFCVATLLSGSQVRVTGCQPTDFNVTIKQASVVWVDFAVGDMKKESEIISTLFGFPGSLVPSLLAGRHSSFEDLDKELGLMLPAVRIQKLEVSVYPVLVLVRKGLILTIHEKQVVRFAKFSRYAETVMKKFKPNTTVIDRVSLLLARLIDENNERNFEGLRSIEDQADELSALLMDPKTPRTRLGPEIYKMKHALIIYLDVLWATMDVVNFLRFGDAEAITDEPRILQRFEFLCGDIERKISLGEHMSEVLASGLEVLQTIYNNQLQILNNRLAVVNNRLAQLAAWLAIVGAAMLVPNTIATVFGIPSLPFPAEWWPFIIFLLAIPTMWAAWITYLLVRKRGWLMPVDETIEKVE